MRRTFVRHRCPDCGKRVTCYVPIHHDGSDVMIPGHKDDRRDDKCLASFKYFYTYKKSRETQLASSDV